jgi:hypothetical protein
MPPEDEIQRHVACMVEMGIEYKSLVGKPEEKSFGRLSDVSAWILQGGEPE